MLTEDKGGGEGPKRSLVGCLAMSRPVSDSDKTKYYTLSTYTVWDTVSHCTDPTTKITHIQVAPTVHHYYVEFKQPMTWHEAKAVITHPGGLYPVKFAAMRSGDGAMFRAAIQFTRDLVKANAIVECEGAGAVAPREVVGIVRPRPQALVFETEEEELRRLRTERARQLGAGTRLPEPYRSPAPTRDEY